MRLSLLLVTCTLFLMRPVNSACQDFVEIEIKLEKSDHIALYTIPEEQSGFTEKNARYKKVSDGEWTVVRWRLKTPIKTFRLDLSNSELNNIELRYIKYSVKQVNKHLTGIKILDEFYPSSFLGVLGADQNSIEFVVNEFEGFFDPILYKSETIAQRRYLDSTRVLISLEMETPTIVRVVGNDSSANKSSTCNRYVTTGPREVEFVLYDLEHLNSIVIYTSLGKSNNVLLRQLEITRAGTSLTFGPFDIARNLSVRDYEDFDLDSKGIKLQNILDRKWEESALRFSVPTEEDERSWIMLGLIFTATSVFWLLNSKFLIANLASLD